MNMYKVYNLPIQHPVLQKTVYYSVESEYLVLSSYGNYATLWSECNMLTSVYTRRPMYQFYTALDSTGNVSWCLHFVNDADKLKETVIMW